MVRRRQLEDDRLFTCMIAVVLLEYNTMLRATEVHDTSTRSLEASSLPISQGKP